MPDPGQKLILVGCGKMGGALLRGIAAALRDSVVTVIEPAPPSGLESLPNVIWKNSQDAIDSSFRPDAVVIAVKPQAITEVLPPYARYAEAVFLSIAAGTTLAKLAELLRNPHAAIVRAMPNLPACIGQGMSAAIANTHVTPKQKTLCDRLLHAVGATAWLGDEALMDAVTALSGSGPAYVFALCEAMAHAGKALGLSAEMAAQLARQTIIGSGALLAKSEESVTDLRRAVTSPKGTTEAALGRLLSGDALDKLMLEAMQAAATHSKELAR